MESLILFLVIAVLVIWGYLWLSLARVCEPSDPVELSQDNPRDVAESRMISEQQRTGRELNGFRWKT